MIAIEPDFTFSANSLQDYLDCPRRFELKYLLKQAWPAVTSKPVLEFEHHIQLGSQFHRLVQQYLSGIPQAALAKAIEDPDLEEWFRNFLVYFDTLDLGQSYPEFPLRISIQNFQVVAVNDLIAINKDGHLCIFDWKTSANLPGKTSLQKRMQTILYPLAAFEAAPNFLPGINVVPEKIQMTYLYVAHRDQNTFTFNYSLGQYEAGKQELQDLITEIQSKESGSFELTTAKKMCNYCVYRSLCERGVVAGDFADIESEDNLEDIIAKIDFDAQDEIAF